MKTFENKVAAITGAGSGIGRALAVALAGQKCALSLSDVNEAGLAETAGLVKDAGVKVTTAKVDVAQKQQMHDWAAQTVADHGKVNLVFNNAGVAVAGTVEGLGYEDYEWIMGINFWGVVYGTKEFLPHLKASGDGHIINVSSVFGLFAQPTQSAYNATKFAVRGFTESLRQELDIANAGVSATCVHPGGIKTNIAKSARTNASMRALTGKDPEKATADFEKMFRTTADEAARVILAGVRSNARRVLIGGDARAIDIMQRLLPTSYQKLVTRALKAQARH
ncbi:MAG TPA: SDR family NAD(P)-dependent oxidoreductase [Stenotrophobium sp.]|jgi:short-subunit dehydrogenase|nr:SDR family NAD(P)-dependent oxidoreductase [Stenotrophobium sp.]